MNKHEGNKEGFFHSTPVIIAMVALAFVGGSTFGAGRFNVDLNSHKAVSGLPTTLDYSGVNDVYQKLRDNYDGTLTADQLQTGMKKGLAEATGDPYTEYFTAKEAKDFEGQVNGTFTGIGAELGKDKDGNIIIVAPVAGNPAEKAGLKPQDIIATVNGQSTSGMALDDAVNKIRGEKGTQVKLGVIRNRSTPLNFTITRDNIQIASVKTDMLDNNIGYIQVNTFGNDTPGLIKDAANKMKTANVKGVILDLRGNPGGLLDSAVAVSSQWLPQGKMILQEKRGSVVEQTYNSNGPSTLQSIPTVVLVDAGSASASEITTGALHDNNAAYVIGQKSYGKGVVQQPICIGGHQQSDGTCSGDMLKVTVASWYRPNGQNINHQGITPDKAVTQNDADTTAGKDDQKQAAIDYLTSKQ